MSDQIFSSRSLDMEIVMNRKIQPITEWKFKKVEAASAEEALRAPVEPNEIVTVPHTWYRPDSYYRGMAIYRTSVECRLSERENAYLEFQGADQWCKIYINKHEAGQHCGWYSTFRIPVKREYLDGDRLEITAVLDNRNTGEISPVFGDFTVFGGLTREVQLLIVPENHFDLMYYGTSGVLVNTEITENGAGKITAVSRVCLTERVSNAFVRYEVWDEAGNQVLCAEGPIGQTKEMLVENPLLWGGTGNAHCYIVKAFLVCDEEVNDAVEMTCGFRSIASDPERGFYLNGQNVRLHGVAKHQDHADCFCAVGKEEQERDIELIREIGANAVRLSHYQHPQYTYDLCDKNGLIVWAEIPMLKMTENPLLIENAKEQLTELILQNMHHPSICFWGIQNEIAMFKDTEYMHEQCRALNDLAAKLDPTRFSAGANLHVVKAESELNKITDIVGYNLYFGWYYGNMEDYSSYLDELHRVQPKAVLGVSEYGVDCNLQFHAEEPEVKDYTEEFQNLFHETVYPIIESKPYLWGSFIWNMFDFSSAIRNEGGIKYKNCKGLVTDDRATKKDAFYYYKAKWSNDPFLHICSKRFKKRNRTKIEIKIYSNAAQLDFYVNDAYIKTLKPSQPGIFLSPETELSEEGTLVKAVSGSLSDEAVFYYTDEPEVSYIYQAGNKGSHVKNWFLEEEIKPGQYSVMDTIDELLKSDEAMQIIEKYLPDDAARMREDGGSLTLQAVIGFIASKYEDLNVPDLNRELSNIGK